MIDVKTLTIQEANQMLANNEITCVELTQACIDAIESNESEINAFVTTTFDLALEKASKIDQEIAEGHEVTGVYGIPYSLKDAYVTKGIKTTAGSKILENYVPAYDAAVYKKLDEAGAILLGKTNMDSFGHGSSTENSHFGVTCNPLDTSRVPGGSSGGSGAAVAYGGGLFSIGEDTGGSNRAPASFCGLVGVKPTYGLVSRYGSIAYASSYDTVGPITKTIQDATIVMDVIAGKDDYDATSIESDNDYEKFINKEDSKSKRYKIGVPEEFFQEGIDPEVKKVIEDAIEKYRELGHEIIDINLPYTKYAVAAYYVIGLSETSSNLNRLDGIRYGLDVETDNWEEKITQVRTEGFTPETKRRILIGTYTLSAGFADQYYNKAQKVRELLKDQFQNAFEQVDIILTPTMPVLPPVIGEHDDDPLKMWLMDAYTCSINPVGIPAISLPAGSIGDLSVGMQLIGPMESEKELFNLGMQFQS